MFLLSRPRRPVGTFSLRVFRCGRLIEEVEERNLWVTGGSVSVAKLVGGTTTNNSITQIGYGTNGSGPETTDTALTSPFYVAVAGVTFPSAGMVTFAFGLTTGQANGMAISEFGLLTAGNVLCARKTRSTPIYKNSTIAFSGFWSVQF